MRAKFERIVQRALDTIPDEFQEYIAQVPVLVEDRPDPELLAELGMDPDELLFGVFLGVPVGELSVFDVVTDVPRIVIFREDLSQAFPDEAELCHEIQTTVLHEVAHLFGLDEARLDELGFG
ncbi:MAG: metallopeptidase family protein [Candidatus Alcyoniella australis]|nr:metallopeptidase family protein [Candidatus Alcyoniella australis]